MSDKKSLKLGNVVFLVGVLIAVIAGIAATQLGAHATTVSLVLVILGFIVGLLNIKEHETTGFLVAAIALSIAGLADLQVIDNLVSPLGTILTALFGNIAVFVAPAALVVALKSVWNLARN